jgi:hypothetical protein
MQKTFYTQLRRCRDTQHEYTPYNDIQRSRLNCDAQIK